MICVTANISHGSNALTYAERGGELIHANGVWGDATEIFEDFKRLQDRNDRAEYKSSHSIISFNPKDDMSKLTNQDLIDISEKYAKAQGFDQNQYAVYLHLEKQHTHLHIVSNRITNQAKCISSSNSYYKNKDFAHAMEKEYSLVPTNRIVRDTENKKDFKEIAKEFKPDNSHAKSIKQVLDICIADSSSMRQFVKKVEQYKIKVHQGRGIAFTDKSGASVKGSQISREYSLKGIEKQILQRGSTINPIEKMSQEKIGLEIDQQSTQQEKGIESSYISIDSFNPFIGETGNTNENNDEDIDELMGKKKRKKKRFKR